MKERKGHMIIGYHPKTGQPVDEAGNLILEYEYRRSGRAKAASAPPPPPIPTRKPVTRGAFQGKLL